MKSVITWLKTYRVQLSVVFFWVLLIVGIRQYMVINDLTFEGLAVALRDLLVGVWYGPLIYILAYLLRPLIFFPASLLTILAGNVYGLMLGFAYGLLAGTLSAGVPYIIGRWFHRENDPQEVREEINALQRFTGLMRRNPFQSVLMMRLLYLPYDTVSAFAGLLRIPFPAFLGATAIGNIAGTFAFVGIGASIEGDVISGDFSLNPSVFLFSIAVFIVSLGVSRILRSQQHKTESEGYISGRETV